MKILVLQHEQVEHPGIFRRFLQEDGHEWVSVHLNDGEVFPSLGGFDALWVMGGPMDVWEEEKYPWLKKEKEFIQEAVVQLGMPFLGLCLGHQLLAESLGGQCGQSDSPEVGVLRVELTGQGPAGIIFDGLPETFCCLQWHSAEVKEMPAGAECLATSSDCRIQAMSWGPRAYSTQFHLEVEDETIDNWVKVPAYYEALCSALGPQGAQTLNAACKAQMSRFAEMAERFYINWLHASSKTR